MKKVTVVIPNWNGMKYLELCLDSLRNQDTDDFEVIVVDNASTDGSVSYIRERYPEVRLIVNSENLGFSGGVNTGIEACSSEFVLLLNNDVECDARFVSALTRAIEKDARIFSVNPKMVNYRDRNLLDDCGDLYTVIGWQAQRGAAQSVNDPAYSKPAKVFSCCAGASIYRRKVFEEIGLFDTMHFAYLEDIDVGYRAMLYGYHNLYEPSAVVYHVGSGSSGAVKYSDFKVRISARNAVYVAYKNMPVIQRMLNAFPMYIGRKLKQAFFRQLGFEQAYLDGVKEGFETRNMTKKVPRGTAGFFRCLYIEGLLIRNTFVYLHEYRKRHLKK